MRNSCRAFCCTWLVGSVGSVIHHSVAYRLELLERFKGLERVQLSCADAGKISDLMTTGTDPEDGIKAPMSM